MSDKDVKDKLKEIKIENYIWCIYIGIIFMSWYANSLEEKYYVNKDIKSKNKYRNIMIIIFSVLVVIYLYFLIDAWESFKKINENTSQKKKELLTLSLIAAFMIFISGLLFLYVTYKDNDLDVEVAFN
ncbi:MAG: hypothetical protein J5634_01860 [Bacilli bacterium]|nr:hypothetical protein [Bacilli bacterium]